MVLPVFWISVAILGVNAGWQPLPDGGMEYIIQLDADTLEALKSGEIIQSDVPPAAGKVSTYKIILGSKQLPRINASGPLDEVTVSKSVGPAEEKSSASASSVNSAGNPMFPKTFSPAPDRKPLIADSAAFIESSNTSSKLVAGEHEDRREIQSEEVAKPWLVLTLIFLGLVASLSGNVYLAWLFADLRGRYKRMLLQKKK
ncbi:MAG: hypothetical protein ACWGMZ_00690 [Thermoguttaceae bacterium]